MSVHLLPQQQHSSKRRPVKPVPLSSTEHSSRVSPAGKHLLYRNDHNRTAAWRTGNQRLRGLLAHEPPFTPETTDVLKTIYNELKQLKTIDGVLQLQKAHAHQPEQHQPQVVPPIQLQPQIQEQDPSLRH